MEWEARAGRRASGEAVQVDREWAAPGERRCCIATETQATGLADRTEAARAFAIEAARLAATTRCRQVVILDVRQLSPVTDFFVIATGSSPRQMRTVADHIEEMAVGANMSAMSRAGYEGETWILTDYVDVIVHIFSEDARQYYDLDHLWGDARRVEWQNGQKVE